MGITEKINSFYYHMALYELQLMNGSDYFNGLSYNSILYINVIEQTENCTVSRLAEVLHITKSAVTIKINELVRQNIVQKQQSASDKRVYYLKLNHETGELMKNYDRIFEKAEAVLRTKYTEEQLALFEEVLETISGYNWRKLTDEQ